MRTRTWAVAPLLIVLSLSGCSGPSAEDDTALDEATSAPRSSTSSPTATATPSPTAPSTTAAPATLAWTGASLWATCQQEWDRQHGGISWTGWEAFRPSDASTTSDGLHYVARYERNAGGDVVADRDCIIGGTRSVPSVFLDPPLDGFDRSKLPAPSTTFAVR